jgi:hypothetical protein
VKDFQARVVTREEWDPVAKKTKELEVFPLKSNRDGRTMEAPLKTVTLPLKVSAIVKFGGNSPEQRFDFNFTELSKEPVSAPAPAVTSARPAAPVTTARNTPARPAARAAAPAPSPAAQPPAAAPARPQPAPVQAPAAPQPSTPTIEVAPEFSAIPAALNAALDESTLPTGTADLLTELSRRALEVEQMVNDGNLGQVWLPAMGTKTVALALSSHANTLPERQRAVATLAVKRVITSTWELDAYGDMGNKQKMSEAYARLASAVADLKAAYAPSR